MQWALDKFTAPAIVRNGRMDLLAVNHLGRGMHSSMYNRTPAGRRTSPDTPSSTKGPRFYPHWDQAADICVAILRTEAGRDPHDSLLQDLVGELSTLSDEFRRRWGAHDVRTHGAGAKTSTMTWSATWSCSTKAST